VAPTTPTRIATLLHTPPIQAPQTPLQTAVPEIPKDPKEAEKEDLGVALELFLEKSREELLSFFQEHAKWDSEKKTLTFYIPIEELEEL